MTESEFRTNFPDDMVVPPLLLQLLQYQNRSRAFYSGHFELSQGGQKTAIASFDGDKEAASHFILFGEESSGSSYGFWLYEGRTLGDAPVVYLGSEGEGWTVLANSLEEFLSLLAVGVDDLGFNAEWMRFNGPKVPSPELIAFQNWLDAECGISKAQNPVEMVANAKSRHPDLQEWLHGWQKSHFGA